MNIPADAIPLTMGDPGPANRNPPILARIWYQRCDGLVFQADNYVYVKAPTMRGPRWGWCRAGYADEPLPFEDPSDFPAAPATASLRERNRILDDQHLLRCELWEDYENRTGRVFGVTHWLPMDQMAAD